MKYSKQRQLIEDAVIMNKIHPCADDIYDILKPQNANLSLGTVYRNLNVLANNGVIRKIAMPNASDRFDGDLSEHYHIICDKCGKIIDVKLSIAEKLSDEIFRQTGVNVKSYELIANGICNKCKE